VDEVKLNATWRRAELRFNRPIEEPLSWRRQSKRREAPHTIVVHSATPGSKAGDIGPKHELAWIGKPLKFLRLHLLSRQLTLPLPSKPLPWSFLLIFIESVGRTTPVAVT
jgi:hypothetical protein